MSLQAATVGCLEANEGRDLRAMMEFLTLSKTSVKRFSDGKPKEALSKLRRRITIGYSRFDDDDDLPILAVESRASIEGSRVTSQRRE